MIALNDRIGLSQLTAGRKHEMFIELQDWDDDKRYAHYGDVVVGNEAEEYALKQLGNYTGTVDALSDNIGMIFLTYDHKRAGKCPKNRHGAGWFKACTSL